VTSAEHKNGLWHITTQNKQGEETLHTAKMIVNAGGPWVEDVIHQKVRLNSTESVRLVRGSHIVTKRLCNHDKCYFFQGEDGRIIFAIPYEDDFTLIGTTDADHDAPDTKPTCTPEETHYLIDFANNYLKQDITTDDVVWTYSGVRPLYDDGADSATAATREYVLRVNTSLGGPALNVFGGKITTYRRLAEAALAKIDETLGKKNENWTAGVPMPGGNFPVNGVTALRKDLALQLPFLEAKTIARLIRQYGTEAFEIFAGADVPEDLGTDFGSGIYQKELDWAIANEWVRTGEDFLWRRSKLGLRTNPDQQAAIDAYCRNA
jgi:glycerol-3-phosphate dehydrogenase